MAGVYERVGMSFWSVKGPKKDFFGQKWYTKG